MAAILDAKETHAHITTAVDVPVKDSYGRTAHYALLRLA